MPKVTVVPDDRLIIVDGHALCFDYPSLDGIHALQWDGECGHIEWEYGPNQPLEAADYDGQVAPFVELWQAEKARLEQAAPRQRPPVWLSSTVREAGSSACARNVTGAWLRPIIC